MSLRRSVTALQLSFALSSCLSHVAFGLDISAELLKQRDPFKMPEDLKAASPQSDLENYSVEEFKLIGILSGGAHKRAMISAPNGRTYFVKEGMKLGNLKGMISRITDRSLLVKERRMTTLGDEELIETALKLPSDRRNERSKDGSEHGR